MSHLFHGARMSKASIYHPGHEWAVMELHPEKGLLWVKSIPARSDRKVSIYGRVQPLRKTKGRDRLVIFFVRFEDAPDSRQQFFEDFKRKVERQREI
jgi:hypothetical protein